jgi:hypothetical protein
MKKFYEVSKNPIIIGGIAAIFFCIDSILTRYLFTLHADISRGFLWVGFVAWTLSFGMKNNNERIRMWLCNIIGFLLATSMIHFSRLFDVNLIGIDLSTLIAVGVLTGCMMYFAHAGKVWLNSLPGIFMGAFLTFSGLGQGLGVMTFTGGLVTLGLILTYSALGCLAAYGSVTLMKKWNKQQPVSSEAIAEEETAEAKDESRNESN